jgi:hypothetical protein
MQVCISKCAAGSIGSERLQKSEQNILRLDAPECLPTGKAFGKAFANAFSFMARFACKYAFAVSMLSCPSHNAMNVNARLKQGHRGAMANDMWRNTPLLKSGATG